MKISKLGIIKNCNVTRLVNSNFIIRYYKIKILFHKENFFCCYYNCLYLLY